MTPAPADKNHLQISCPACQQRFKVGTELLGKTVECGSCEQRFEVTDEVIIKGQKFYPGERDSAKLNQFQRVPGEQIHPAIYTPAGPPPTSQKGYYSPITKVSAGRIAVGWVGVLLVAALVYFLGFDIEGPLKTMPLASRLVIAVVGGALALAMIAFANPRTRKRTVPFAALFVVALLAIPFVFDSKPLAPITTKDDGPPIIHREAAVIEEDNSVEGLRKRLGLEPLELEINRVGEAPGGMKAYGIWLRDLNDSNRLAVRDYLMRATGADPASHIYPRDGRDYLMVLTGVTKSLEEIDAITANFSRTHKLHPELHVVEVQVDAQVFVEGPLEKLTNKTNPAFYDLNKRELESIQLDRVKRAVNRLGDVEPKIYRDDITRHLIALLGTEAVDFPGEVCRTLMVWAQDPKLAGDVALARMIRMHEAKKKIPKDMVALLAKAKNPGAIPIVQALWLDDPTQWERLLGEFGPVAEPGILKLFPTMEGTIRHSAARVLAMAGTKASFPVLEAARPTAEAELVILIDDAEKAINQRN